MVAGRVASHAIIHKHGAVCNPIKMQYETTENEPIETMASIYDSHDRFNIVGRFSRLYRNNGFCDCCNRQRLKFCFVDRRLIVGTKWKRSRRSLNFFCISDHRSYEHTYVVSGREVGRQSPSLH